MAVKRTGIRGAIYISAELDIFFNLAFESFLTSRRAESCKTTPADELFLWRNRPTVVIGRHQNPWSECNLPLMKQNSVSLSRRYSGGGAVYQDLGNTCFTFVNPPDLRAKEENNKILIDSLENAFAIEVASSGRNDLICGQRKFSGAAYRQMPNCSLHHGTIMLSVDLDLLQKLLTPSTFKLNSKGIKSVAARVMNLSEVNSSIEHEKLVDAIVHQFVKQKDFQEHEFEIEVISKSSNLCNDPLFNFHFETLSSWDWRFGNTYPFSITLENRFSWGCVEANFNVIDGVIKDVKIFTDCLHTEYADTVNNVLKGVKYEARALQHQLEAIIRECDDDFLKGLYAEFFDWLCENI